MAEVVRASYYHPRVLVIGIDLGTQSCKAVVCDDQLVVRGHHASGYPTSHPFPDHAEQDPCAWELALGAAVAGALAAAGAHADDVAAIAIAGQLDGCVAIDANCRPLHRALIWQDRRATSQIARAATIDVFSRTGQVSDPSHMAPKLCWLRDHGVAAARFHQPVTYLVERLTGAAVIDPALASTTMLLELATACWDRELLDAFAVAADQLPAIRPACAIAGELTTDAARLVGLRAGTPVAVGTGDDFASPLGAGVVAPGPIVCTIGTAEVVGTLSAALVLDRHAEPMVETHAYPAGGFFIENPGWLSGGAVRWAVALLGLSSAAELDALAAAAPPGAAGVTFIPSLAGAMTPVWRPHARGTLHGLAAGHGRSHIARAILEGLAFACRDVVERLAALGLTTDRVVLLGGGARSAVWSQLRADALGITQQIAANPDTCSIGAAMIAAVAVAIHRDLVTAAGVVPRAVDGYSPRERLDEPYQRYRRLVAQLAPLAATPW